VVRDSLQTPIDPQQQAILEPILTDSATISRIDDSLLSVSCIARESGRDRQTITRMIDDQGISPSGTRSKHPVYRLRDVLRMFEIRSGDVERSAQEKLALARAAESEVDRQLKTLKLGREQANLIDAEDVRSEINRIVTIVVRSISTVADRLERDKRVTPEIFEYVDGLMNALRDEIAAEVRA